MSIRKALCVGINQFRNYPGAALQGCVNDVVSMKGLLKDFLGFQDADITTLTDAQATKAAIMTALKEMVAGAKAGRYGHLVFSMSSHGTQVPDLNGDETDHVDEAFCPHDLAALNGNWDPKHVIVDDELRDLFVQVPAGVLLEVYLDTCHSGTGLRGIDLLLDRKPRFLPPPSLEAFLQAQRQAPRTLTRALLEAKGLPHQILWAACKPDQTSADARINNGWHGAFTYFFEKEMRACKNQLSRSQVLVKVRADLAAGHYTQVPQLECPATDKKLAAQPRQAVL